jgi:hypothetical protein
MAGPSAKYVERAGQIVRAVDIGAQVLAGHSEDHDMIEFGAELKELTTRSPQTVAGLRHLESAFAGDLTGRPGKVEGQRTPAASGRARPHPAKRRCGSSSKWHRDKPPREGETVLQATSPVLAARLRPFADGIGERRVVPPALHVSRLLAARLRARLPSHPGEGAMSSARRS